MIYWFNDLVHVSSLETKGPAKGLQTIIAIRSNKCSLRFNYIFTNRVVPYWKNLPENLITAPNLDIF